MRRDDIFAAVAAARRFIKLAEAVNRADAVDRDCGAGPRERGALKRQSMELTRTLADLRHPWRK